MSVCLSVCLSVCELIFSRTMKRTEPKFSALLHLCICWKQSKYGSLGIDKAFGLNLKKTSINPEPRKFCSTRKKAPHENYLVILFLFCSSSKFLNIASDRKEIDLSTFVEKISSLICSTSTLSRVSNCQTILHKSLFMNCGFWFRMDICMAFDGVWWGGSLTGGLQLMYLGGGIGPCLLGQNVSVRLAIAHRKNMKTWFSPGLFCVSISDQSKFGSTLWNPNYRTPLVVCHALFLTCVKGVSMNSLGACRLRVHWTSVWMDARV